MGLPHTTSRHRGWLYEAAGRMRTLWLAKAVGTTVGISFFFFVYFWVLRHPVFSVTTMPLTAVDRAIGFRPGVLPIYLSLWLYVSLAPALVRVGRELASYAVAAVVLSAAGLGIFLFWPTTVSVAEVDLSSYPAVAFLKSTDAAGNACPSLHVAFAVFTAFWFERLLRELRAGPLARTLNVLWCAGIVYSTIALRQHVFIDVAAGALLGAMIAALHFAWLHLSEVRGQR
jgi:membrane-associated phospholipid phosphatase